MPAEAPAAFDCASASGVSEAECDALVSLYNSTNGAGWADHTHWLEKPDVCTWFGVGCGDGAVLRLDLGGNNLQGPLPNTLGSLKYLDSLMLGGNKLTGGLPPSLGSAAYMNVLDISQNAGLSGPVPMAYTGMHLLRFWFDQTGLCEPPDTEFKDWLGTITDLRRTDVACVFTPTPTPYSDAHADPDAQPHSDAHADPDA